MLTMLPSPTLSRRSSGSLQPTTPPDEPTNHIHPLAKRRRSGSSLSFTAAPTPLHSSSLFTPLVIPAPPSQHTGPPYKKSRSSPNLQLTHQHLLAASTSTSRYRRYDDYVMHRNDSDDELDPPISFPSPTVRQRHAPGRATSDARLPTARIHPPSTTVSPPRALDWIYAGSQALAVIPAVLGTLYLVTAAINRRPDAPAYPSRTDFLIAAVWAVLTGYQCLCLASGLLTRWRAYYSPLPTLIRLLGLQAICWPATHATLLVLDVSIRPLMCWAVIGSTTCVSRAIQLWVVSNLEPGKTQRRWNWADVGVKCALPSGILYFVTAWAVLLQREFNRC